jgi:hypothetical protein
MATLKPQPLPYTKKGIFGAAGQGMTGIGARVGQSVSGLWSSLSSGIASSLLNRSLGISADDATKVAAARQAGAIAPGDAEKLLRGEVLGEGNGDGEKTSLENEIETLYSGFKKSHTGEGPLEMDEARREVQEQVRKLRKEEGKVRALNANGRVDYAIQE